MEIGRYHQFKFPVTILGKGTPPIEFEIIGDLPQGLMFNSETRILSGTPVELLDEQEFRYRATDSQGPTPRIAEMIFNLAVVARFMWNPSSPNAFGIEDTTWAYLAMDTEEVLLELPQATGGRPDYIYEILDEEGNEATLPEGVTLDLTDFTLSGTPTALYESQILTWRVTDDQPEWQWDELQGGPRELRYDFQLTVVPDGIPGPPLNLREIPLSSSDDPTTQRRIAWDEPELLAESVLFYEVKRGFAGTDVEDSTREIVTLGQEYLMENLLPNIGYTVWVRACSGGTLNEDCGPWASLDLITDQTDTTPMFIDYESPYFITAIQGVAETFELPQASGGNLPLVYTVTFPTSQITGIEVDEGEQKLIVLDVVEVGTYPMVWFVRDLDQDTSSITIIVEVIELPEDETPRFQNLTERFEVVNGIGGTFDLPVATGGNPPLVYSFSFPGSQIPGISANETARTLSIAPSVSHGIYTALWTVTDTDVGPNLPSESETVTLTIEVMASPLNFITNQPPIQMYVGIQYDEPLVSAGGGTEPITYSLTPSLPPNLFYDATNNRINGTPLAVGNVYNGTLTATSGNETVTLPITITILDEIGTPGLVRLLFGSSGMAQGGIRASWLEPNNAIEAEITGYRIEYRLDQSGTSFLFGGTGPSLSWSYSDLIPGQRYVIRVQAINPAESGPWSETTAIAQVDTSPSFPSDQSETATIGTPFNFLRPNATGGNLPLTYTLFLSPSVAGLTITNFNITGTPTGSADSYDIIWIVTDSDGDTDSFTLNLTVIEEDVSPSFPSDQSRTATVGTSFSYTRPNATSGNDPLTYALFSGINIPGLSIGSTGITGTPTGSADSYDIIWIVTDSDGDTDSFTLSLTVEVQDLSPSFPSDQSRTATVGTSFSYTRPNATSGNDPLTYALFSGINIPGLSISSTGITGTPTGSADSYDIIWIVTDSDGDTDTFTLDLTVTDQDLSPSFPSDQSRTATIGTPFNFLRPNATDGNPPLIYTLFLSPSVAGLTITNFNITGTPTGSADSYDIIWIVTDSDGDTDSFTLSLTVAGTGPPNEDPTVSVTGGGTVNGGSNNAVNASASDQDGTISSYSWSSTGGTVNGSGANVIWIAPSAQTNDRSYTVSCTVTDNEGGTDSDSTTFTVRAIAVSNIDPTVNVSGGGRVSGGSNNSVSASASDQDGTISSYSWSSSGGSVNGSGSSVIWIAPSAQTNDRSYSVSCTVTDNEGGTDSDSTSFTVTGVGQPNIDPTVNVSGGGRVSGGSNNSVSASASDQDGTISSYSWSSSGGSVNGSGSSVIWIAPSAQTNDRSYSVSCTVTDNEGGTDSDSTSFTVTGVGQPNIDPTVNVSGGGRVSGGSNNSVSASASDQDGTISSYSWSSSGGSVNGSGSSVIWIAPSAQTNDRSYSVSCTVTDNEGGTDSDSTSFTVTGVGQPNIDPTVNVSGGGRVSGGSNNSVSASASDQDGTISSYSWSSSGGSVNGSGSSVIWIAPSAQTNDRSYSVSCTVTDNEGGTDSDSTSFTVTGVGQPAQDPSFPSDQSSTATIGFLFLYSRPNATGGNPPLNYSLLSPPSIPGLNISDGGISGLPSAGSGGNYSIRWRVTDSDGDSDTFTLSLFVNDPS